MIQNNYTELIWSIRNNWSIKEAEDVLIFICQRALTKIESQERNWLTERRLTNSNEYFANRNKLNLLLLLMNSLFLKHVFPVFKYFSASTKLVSFV